MKTQWTLTVLSMALTCGFLPSGAQAATPALSKQTVVGPVVASIAFEGNSRITTRALRQAVRLPLGTALSASVIQPELDRITALYRDHGNAYVQPSIVETAPGKVRVTFQVHEGVTAYEGPEEAPLPVWFDVYFGNTMVCAATTTGNDLCHMWLNRDGTFVLTDPGGIHTGYWKAGKVRADGRVPLCRYWTRSDFVLPEEVRKAQASYAAAPARVAEQKARLAGSTADASQPAPALATAPKGGKLCLTSNFRTTCTYHEDFSKLSPELQRKAALSTTNLRAEEGICYAHGPHKVGEVWYEWDDPLPGQAGLDRQMLLAGRQ